jgi:lysylphosphatidylglycerol synthetase-like protein (DUF2156 family)
MNFENSQPGRILPSKRRARAVRICAAIVAAPVATALLFALYDAAEGTAQVHGFLNAVTNATWLACIIYLFALVTALVGGCLHISCIAEWGSPRFSRMVWEVPSLEL